MRNNHIVAAGAIVIAGLLSGAAFAQSGGISVPGIMKAEGSQGSKITRTEITVSGNKARGVMAGGGSASFKVGAIEMDGMANVNSVNITGSEVKGSKITVMDNEAANIKAIGGTANVNSVNIN